ncbi:MAG TPA: ABC transporter permease [Euzebya sp.]|nr:ABC transporter permease [Euzebya sp.]
MSTTTAPDRGPGKGLEATAPEAFAMSSWEVLTLVTTREIRERGRSKSFLVSALVSLLLLGAAIVLPQVFSDTDVTIRVGHVGEGNESILRVTQSIATEDLEADGELTFEVSRFDSVEEAEQALVDEDVEVVLINGAELLREGSGGFAGSDTDRFLQRAAAVVQLEDSLEGSSTTVEEVAGLLNSQPLAQRTLAGETDDGLETARSLIAYGGMMLLYIAILTFGSWTLMGIAEEKSSRVVEILLATVRPWQLMAGKILGIGLLGLGQFVITVVWALLLIRVTGALELPAIPVDSAITLTVWFVLGYGIYAVAFATAGAMVSRMEDAQSASFPITMVGVGGLLLSFSVLSSPSGAIARVTTFIPVMSPFVVPIRVAFGEISLWEHLTSIAVALAVMGVMVRFAGRVYAGGLLHFGGRIGLRQAYRSAEI